MVVTAIGQICSTASMTHNLAQCQTLIQRAVSAGAKALFLPEASDYISTSASESISLCQSAATSPFVQGLRSSARKYKLHINVGIHEPTSPPSNRIANSLIWINSNGDIAHRYQKLHVFDIDLRDSGGPRLKESDSTEPGSKIVEPYDLGDDGVIQVGSLICFDLRFPEPAISLRGRGARVLLYPSAFTVPTGKLHWEVLLRARAIENQCFVIAAAQCGRHNAKRISYGDSIAIGPNGQVMGRLERVDNTGIENEGVRSPELLVVDLDMTEVEKVRRGIPLLRRTDVYSEV